MNEFDQIMYESFFDELGRLEKVGMLNKFAAPAGFFRQLWGGARQLVKNPAVSGSHLSRAWGRGVAKAAPDAGEWSKAWSGLKGVMGTAQGKALATGAGATATGLGGAGYLLGRNRSNQNQNVYVG